LEKTLDVSMVEKDRRRKEGEKKEMKKKKWREPFLIVSEKKKEIFLSLFRKLDLSYYFFDFNLGVRHRRHYEAMGPEGG